MQAACVQHTNRSPSELDLCRKGQFCQLERHLARSEGWVSRGPGALTYRRKATWVQRTCPLSFRTPSVAVSPSLFRCFF